MKQNILVFNGYYYPAKKYGGPATSMANIVKYCSDKYQFYIVAANHDLNEKEIFENIHEGWNVVGNAKVLYIDPRTTSYSNKRVQNIIEEVKPKLVWISGILVPAENWNVAYVCRKKKIPFLVSPRGEVFDHTFHSKYLKKKIVSLIAVWARVYREAYFHATCNEEITGLEKYYAVNSRNVYMVPNIPTTIEAEKKTIKKEKNELKVIFISRIVEKKNLLLAIKAVNKAKIKVQFDIYGPIESEEYWRRCEEEISHHGDNITIKYMGSLNPSDVKTVFMNYHVFIFPTFSENYGHVIAEALSMSCPIILTKNTTPWDDVDGVAGYLASLDNLQGFVDAINKVGEMNQKEYDELLDKTGQYFNMKMNTDNAVQGHKEMFRKIIEDYQNKWKK